MSPQCRIFGAGNEMQIGTRQEGRVVLGFCSHRAMMRSHGYLQIIFLDDFDSYFLMTVDAH
jgi:hypothetical protein